MRPTHAVLLFYLTFVGGSIQHAGKISSKLGLKCHFNRIKSIYFLYNKENAVQHRQCTSWSTYSVTMATNSISSGISIDVKSRLFFPASSIRGFFVPMKQKVERLYS